MSLVTVLCDKKTSNAAKLLSALRASAKVANLLQTCVVKNYFCSVSRTKTSRERISLRISETAMAQKLH